MIDQKQEELKGKPKHKLENLAIGSSSMQVLSGMNPAASVPQEQLQIRKKEDVIFLRSSPPNNQRQPAPIHSNQLKHSDNGDEEEIVLFTLYPFQIEEIIEIDDHHHDDFEVSRPQVASPCPNPLQRQLVDNFVTESQSRLDHQAFDLDNDHDIEAQSRILNAIDDDLKDDPLTINHSPPSRQSSHLTTNAKEVHHIFQGEPSQFKNPLRNPHNLAFQSLDDQQLSRKWENPGQPERLQTSTQYDRLSMSKVELNYSNQENFNQTQTDGDIPQLTIEESKNLQECYNNEEINEEEKQYLLEALEQEEEEKRLLRGRNSMLEEMEDDDIVNQNSSKSSSKERSPSHQEKGQENEEIKIQKKNTSKNVKKEENKGDSYDTSLTHSSKQSFGRGTRFSYFAASSLSDDRWVCPICLDIFEDAVETPCCHNLFCEKCILKTPTCPLCNQRIVGQLKPNIPIRRLVFELSIPCLNNQCEEVVRKGEIDKHLKACHYTPILCPNNEFCGKIIRKELETHKSELCPFRIVECFKNCGLMLPLNDMDDHIQDECPKSQLPCKNNCGHIVERGDIERHINIDCPLEIIECPNKGENLFEEGCAVKLKRKDMESHKITCNFRRVYCPNQKCNSIIMYKDLHTHDERCLFKIIECDNKCGHKIQRQNMDKHKDQCEFQLVKCPYYDLGCKIEILRKDYIGHLQEEGFNHSIIFIEGQKKKNREIDELKCEIYSLRKEYDVEIKTMFMELSRVKEEIYMMKYKNGNAMQGNNQISSNSVNNVGNINIGVNKKDERRYEPHHHSSSANSFDYSMKQNLRENRAIPHTIERNNQNQVGQNGLRILGAFEQSNSVEIESNAASMAASLHSLGMPHQIYSSQQFRNISQSNPLNTINQPIQNIPLQPNNRNIYNKPPLMGRPGGNQGGAQGAVSSNPYGENSNRGRIPLIPQSLNNNNESIANLSERKNPMAVLLGSVNSLDSQPNNQNYIQHNGNQMQFRDFWDHLVQLAKETSEQQQNEGRRMASNQGTRRNMSNQRREGEPESGRNNRGHNRNQQDLDSSNVLYDDDFEIEEEKLNF